MVSVTRTSAAMALLIRLLAACTCPCCGALRAAVLGLACAGGLGLAANRQRPASLSQAGPACLPTLLACLRRSPPSLHVLSTKHCCRRGTICDDGGTDAMATVACRQLGLGSAGILKTNAYFGEGTGPIYMGGVRACHASMAGRDHSTPIFPGGACTGGFWSLARRASTTFTLVQLAWAGGKRNRSAVPWDFCS